TLFVPKSRKVKFEATCVFEDLTNLPYVSGLYFIKWKIKNGSSGTSAKSTVKDHVVTWQSQFRTDVTMVIGKDGVLQPCELVILVKQVVNAGKSSEDVGMVSINLAEFAASPSSSRRYLLQESRVNSILRLTVNMKLLKGGKSTVY
ncbi:EEIG1/EHBP1 N-terminal domain-containing protein, partial [Gaertneriomyces semiglobifer]